MNIRKTTPLIMLLVLMVGVLLSACDNSTTSDAKATVQTASNEAATQVSGAVSGAATEVSGAVSGMATEVSGAASGMATEVSGAAGGVVSGAATQVSGAAGSVATQVGGAVSGAATEVSGAVTGMADATALMGKTWKWQNTKMNDGAMTKATNPDNYTIEFLPAGAMTIKADCNNAAGTYKMDGNTLTIEVGAMTMMACPEGSQADVFIKDLNNVGSYLMDGDNLVLEIKMDSGSMTFATK